MSSAPTTTAPTEAAPLTANPPLFHPLVGGDPLMLGRLLTEVGSIPPRRWLHVGITLSAATCRWPISLVEGTYARWRIRQAGPLPPPVFIVGHWRSGTTHLYNIMSRSRAFGYVPPLATGLPWDILGLARVLSPLLNRLLPGERYIDPIPVLPDSPQEDEAALANMQRVSYYHGLYFPRHLQRKFYEGVFFDGCSRRQIELWQRRFLHFLHKVSLLQDGRRLLVKNPVYTARIAMLKELLPGAKFIHIHRNPYDVFRSMRNFYTKLLQALSLQPFDHVDIDGHILESYPRLMDRLIEDSASLGADELVELSYDELTADPLEQLQRIYERLDLGDFEADRPALADYLASVEDYRPNRYRQADPEVKRIVEERWDRYIRHWGYTIPG